MLGGFRMDSCERKLIGSKCLADVRGKGKTEFIIVGVGETRHPAKTPIFFGRRGVASSFLLKPIPCFFVADADRAPCVFPVLKDAVSMPAEKRKPEPRYVSLNAMAAMTDGIFAKGTEPSGKPKLRKIDCGKLLLSSFDRKKDAPGWVLLEIGYDGVFSESFPFSSFGTEWWTAEDAADEWLESALAEWGEARKAVSLAQN
jgi:hypothetical protein